MTDNCSLLYIIYSLHSNKHMDARDNKNVTHIHLIVLKNILLLVKLFLKKVFFLYISI